MFTPPALAANVPRGSQPAIHCASVLLPEPLPPRIASFSPGATASVTSSSTGRVS